MASHDQQQRHSYRADDEAKGQAQECTGGVMGSVENKTQEVGDPIYDAIQEAKEVVKQKASEAAQKAQDTAHYSKDKSGMHGQG